MRTIMPGDFFENLSLFQGLTPNQMALVRPLFSPWNCQGDEVLFEQGEPAEHLYVVLYGEIVVNYKPEDGPPITVARVQAGGVVGWSAALGSRVYTSSASCTSSTQMLRVRGMDLCSLCEQYPAIGGIVLERLAAIIAERMRNTHPQVVALLEQGLRNTVHHQEVRS